MKLKKSTLTKLQNPKIFVFAAFVAAGIAVFGFAPKAQAASTVYTCTWNGSVNTDWTTAGNWSNCNSTYPSNSSCTGGSGTCYWANINTTTNVTILGSSVTICGLIVGTTGGNGDLTINNSLSLLNNSNCGSAPSGFTARGMLKIGGGSTTGTLTLNGSLTTNENAGGTIIGTNGTITGSGTWNQNGVHDLTSNGAISGSWTMSSSATSFTNVGAISGGWNMTMGEPTSYFDNSGTLNMTGGTISTKTILCIGSSNNLYNYTASICPSLMNENCVIGHVLTINAASYLHASNNVELTSGGTPLNDLSDGSCAYGSTLDIGGTLTYSSTSNTNVNYKTGESWSNLTLAPSGAGSPTYTLGSSMLGGTTLTIGDGTHPVTVNAASNNSSITIGANLILNGNTTFTKGSGTLTFIYTGNWTDNNATKQDMGLVQLYDNSLTTNLGSSVTATSVNVGTTDTLNLGSSGYALTLTGSGTTTNRPLIVNGTLNEGTNSTVAFTGTSATDIEDETYNNLSFSSTGPYRLGHASSQTINVAGNLTIDNSASVLANTYNPAINIGGNLTLNSASTFTKGSGTLTFNGSGTKTWTDNNATKQDMGAVAVNASGKIINLGSSVKDTTVNIAAGTLSLGSNTLTLTGNGTPISNSGTFTVTSGTVEYAPGATSGVNVTSMTYHNVTFNKSGNTFSLTSGGLTTNSGGNITITAGTLDIVNGQNYPISVGGNWINNDTFQPRAGTVTFSGTTAISGSSTNSFNNVTISSSLTGPSSANINVAGNWANSGTFTHNSGTVTFTGNTAISGSSTNTFNNVAISGSLTAPSSNMNVAGNWANSGTFTHNSGTVIFNGTTTVSGSSPNNFNNVAISGALTAPSANINIAGSWTNSGTFAANSGTVTFNAASETSTISGGGSPFYDVIFNSSSGNWRFSGGATVGHNLTITSIGSLTLPNPYQLEVDGTYSIAGTETSKTSWNSGSTFYLNGTSQTISSGDAYATLQIGANTDIRMWNSSASTVTADPSGSLYSMDNNNSDGYLYIYGDYHTQTNDYWSYATDFDGTAGANRRAQVFIDPAAKVTVDNGTTLAAIGTSGSHTLVSRIGSSDGYEMSVASGGTINFQYADFAYQDGPKGLEILDGAHVSSLNNTKFSNLVDSGSSDAYITVVSTVIDSTTGDITGVDFESGSGANFNVNRTGSDYKGYWRFTSASGGLAGEAYDGKEGANEADPGMIIWTDSAPFKTRIWGGGVKIRGGGVRFR